MGCRKYSAKLDGINEDFSVLTWLTAFILFLTKYFTYEVITVDINNMLKWPELEFGEFLWFIGICLSIIDNPGTNRAEYFSDTPVDIFDQFV